MTTPVVPVVAERQQPTPTIGGVFGEMLAFVAYGARACGNTMRMADSVTYAGVQMAEGFAKTSAVESDLKLREAVFMLQVKTAALNAKLGLEVNAPIQPPVKPALQM